MSREQMIQQFDALNEREIQLQAIIEESNQYSSRLMTRRISQENPPHLITSPYDIKRHKASEDSEIVKKVRTVHRLCNDSSPTNLILVLELLLKLYLIFPWYCMWYCYTEKRRGAKESRNRKRLHLFLHSSWSRW